jgi:hypothetical protein
MLRGFRQAQRRQAIQTELSTKPLTRLNTYGLSVTITKKGIDLLKSV